MVEMTVLLDLGKSEAEEYYVKKVEKAKCSQSSRHRRCHLRNS